MAHNLKTTFSNACSWKLLKISLKYVAWVQTESILVLVLVMDRCQNRQEAIVWINGSLIYWHIYASVALDELKSYSPVYCSNV